MSLRFEFAAEIHDGTITLPPDIAGRLRVRGLHNVRVVLSTVAEEEERLAARGISADVIDRVAEVQRFDRDVATVVLVGEGILAGDAATADGLATRLRELLPTSQDGR